MRHKFLYNPQNIRAIIHNEGQTYIYDNERTGFQELPNRIELWEIDEGGRLYKLQGWNKSKIQFAIYGYELETGAFEPLRPYISYIETLNKKIQ